MTAPSDLIQNLPVAPTGPGGTGKPTSKVAPQGGDSFADAIAAAQATGAPVATTGQPGSNTGISQTADKDQPIAAATQALDALLLAGTQAQPSTTDSAEILSMQVVSTGIAVPANTFTTFADTAASVSARPSSSDVPNSSNAAALEVARAAQRSTTDSAEALSMPAVSTGIAVPANTSTTFADAAASVSARPSSSAVTNSSNAAALEVARAAQPAAGPSQSPPVEAPRSEVIRLRQADSANPTADTLADVNAGAAQPIAIDPAVAATIAQTVFAVPSTGNFSPANPVSFAAGNSVDPAKLAATGFVADTLSSTPTALTSVTPDTSAAQSPWMTLAPDNLAFRLADRTFGGANTNVDLAPTQLALQNIEQQLGAIESQLGGSPISTESADTAAPKAIDAPNGGITSINQGPQANLSTGTPEPVRLSVNAPVEQSSRWASEMGDRLAWVARNGMSSATLQVNPPQLGPIEVRIQMSGDQAAVSFAAVQPQTREAIQQALPALASSFAAQGLSLGQTSVGRDNQPQQSRGDGSSGNNANRGTDAIGAVSVDNISSSSGAIGTNRGGTGLVDTFV